MQSESPEAVPDSVEDEREGEHDRFVEEVAHDAARASVVPSPMHQEELAQERELADGIVGGIHGLQRDAGAPDGQNKTCLRDA